MKRRLLVSAMAAATLTLAQERCTTQPWTYPAGPPTAVRPSLQRTIVASAETRSVAGDADDPAIWVHPTDPGLSLIIGTDKDNGLHTWDLDGRPVQFIPNGEPNNVDLRYGFDLGGDKVDIVAMDNRRQHRIEVYRVEPETRQLVNISGDGIESDLTETYGFCMYRSPATRKVYAFVNDKDGDVEQYELAADAKGIVRGDLVRSFDVGTRTEGCVADDETGTFFVSAERIAVWRYGAEPDAGTDRHLVDDAAGHLVPEVEGLAIYYGRGGAGYLIVSSQGSDDFVVYDRRPPHAFVTRFRVVAGIGDDPVTHTDGLDVANSALGPRFPFGLFIAHDAADEQPRNNYKLVPWERIAQSASPPLIIDPASYHPRTTDHKSAGGRLNHGF